MKDASRLLRKLRRKIYREVPIATWNRAAEVDWRGSYDSLMSTFRRGDCGALSGGTALALWRAATDAGFHAWCYDFGFPESLTHMVTVVELDGRFRVHDPFLNFEYRADFYEILEGLRADRLPDIRREARDRKIYVVDPSCESQLTVDWLTAHADRELDRIGSLRRFEVLWDRDALLATLARSEAVYRDLETRGYPADLSYLMLHPIGVFDGREHHRNSETMPLIAGRDLRSPVAGLRAAMQQLTQDLTVERGQLADKSAISGRLESELAEARSQLLATSGAVEQLSAQSAQLRAAIDDSSRQWDAERQALSQGNSALEERRAVLEAALAEARSQLLAASGEAEQLSAQAAQLRAAVDDSDRRWSAERQALSQENIALAERRAALETELAEARSQLLAASGEVEQLSAQVVQLRAAIDDTSRQWAAERRALSQESSALEERPAALEAKFAEARTHHAAAAEEARRLADQVVQLRAALDETAQRSGTERDALGREKEWLEVRRTALETDLGEARSQLLAASEQVEQLSAQAAQLRAAIDDASRQWAAERQALLQENLALEERRTALETDLAEATAGEAEARDDAQRQGRQIIQLQAVVQALGEESGKAFAASAAAQLRAEKAEAQASWADFHVAELVEKEAVAASELARGRDEVAALVFGIKRLLSIDDLPGNDLPMAVAHLREHFRTLERELDQAEAERDRLGAALQERTTRRSRPAGRVRRYIRRLFQRADHHGNFVAIRG